MKFSTALTSLILIAPLFAGEAFAARGFGGKGGAGKGGNKGSGNNNGAANNTSTTAAAASTSAAAAAAANTTSAATNGTVLANNGAANNTGAGAGGNEQTSLTLDPSVIAKGFESNGQQVPTAGQVASLTSSNNFINFCALTPNVPITNGQQIKTGSCNPAPMGIIAATTNMPSAKFVVPVNVNQAGDIIGHSHLTIQNVGSFTSTTPQDPNVFAFFKGLNTAAVNGVITQAVTAGLPAGTYRICSINTDANHTPCLVAVAQHGMLDDCVYFSVGGNGANNAFGGNATASGAGAGASNSTAPPPAAAANSTAPPPAAAANATSSAPPAASSAAAAGKGAGQGGKGAGQGGKGGKGGRRVRAGQRQSRLGRDYY
ncbi:hypothetical protein BJV77DRAFT_1059431 [Russula vinacea]|nr:hypothetical protein BJV77DRAFT_1059431 [Russula vinacea]